MRALRSVAFLTLVCAWLFSAGSARVVADGWCDHGLNTIAYYENDNFMSCGTAEDACNSFETNSETCRDICITFCGTAVDAAFNDCDLYQRDPPLDFLCDYLASCYCAYDYGQ